MILDPYIIEDGQPVRRLFLKIPFTGQGRKWHPNTTRDTQVITLDITLKNNMIYVLLGRPDWDHIGIAARAETICSNLLMLMEACGLVLERKNVHWFEIVHILKPIRFQSIHFERDDGTYLSNPSWRSVPASSFPFNVDRYSILPQREIQE